jgi:hypothetical protein
MLERSKVIRDLIPILGDPQRAGKEYRFNSPFNEHFSDPSKDDNGYHLYVNPDKGVWICYKSSLSGGIKKLLKLLNATPSDDDDYFAPVEKPSLDDLAAQIRAMKKGPRDAGMKCAELPEWYCGVVPGSSAYEYLTGRGLSQEDIELYKIGQGSGERTGWVLLPTFDEDGKCEFWVSRSTTEKRYLNPKIPRKWHVGYLNIAKKYSPDMVILCEGAFSAIAAGKDAVCTYGKFVTDEQVRRIHHAGFKEIVIALDPDASEEALDTVGKCIRIGFPKVSYIELPRGFDPADIGREMFREYVYYREPMCRTAILEHKVRR